MRKGLNKPFTAKEVSELQHPFNPSGFDLNRRMRRTKFKNTSPVSHVQIAPIFDKEDLMRKFILGWKRIIHYKTAKLI